jgi:crotonobetaine/carnitine-CoA ligase
LTDIRGRPIESEDELKVNVILKEGESASAEDLCRFVNENAPHYFVPRYLDFVESLPYTPTNKVQKFKLREQGVADTTWDLKTSGFKVQR